MYVLGNFLYSWATLEIYIQVRTYLLKLLAFPSGGVVAEGTKTVTVGLLFCLFCDLPPPPRSDDGRVDVS